MPRQYFENIARGWRNTADQGGCRKKLKLNTINDKILLYMTRINQLLYISQHNLSTSHVVSDVLATGLFVNKHKTERCTILKQAKLPVKHETTS